MNPFFELTLAVAVSMLVIPLVRRFAPRLGLVDMPDPRKVHTVPIPRVMQLQLELDQKTAVEVLTIEPDGPADQAGVQPDDQIVSIGEQPVTSVDDLHKLLTLLPIEVPATITLLRGQRRLERMVLPQEYRHPAPAE